MVKEIEGSAGGLAWVEAWGADTMSGESDFSGFCCDASDALTLDVDAVDCKLAVRVEDLTGVLAIASPSPPTRDSGSENSASQCSPLTQLNRAIPPYKPKKHIAQNRIGSHPILIKANATANRAIPNN